MLGSSDVGGCHRRQRLWVLAADARRIGRGQSLVNVQPGQPDPVGGGEVALLPTPAAADGSGGRRAKNLEWDGGTAYRPSGAKASVSLQEAMDLLPTPRTSDTNGAGGHGAGGLDLRTAIDPLPTPTAADSRGARNATSGRSADSQHHAGTTLCDVAHTADFGKHQAAVNRWSSIVGFPPAPTDDKGRLNPPFVEWMMGYPAGWVTDLGLTRTAKLKALGNAVQPQAGAAAFTALARRLEAIEAAA